MKQKPIKSAPKREKKPTLAKETPLIKEEVKEKTKPSLKPYQLIGSFNFVQKKTIKRKGNHHGETSYHIDVTDKIENMPQESIKKIYAFVDVIKREQVWKDLEENNWPDKRYLLFCYKETRGTFKGLYRLFDWKEIPKS